MRRSLITHLTHHHPSLVRRGIATAIQVVLTPLLTKGLGVVELTVRKVS